MGSTPLFCNGAVPCITLNIDGDLSILAQNLNLVYDLNGIGNSTITLTSVQTATYVLLHELGHLVPGLDPDANNYNNPFNIGILQNCIGVKVPQ